MSMRTKLLFSAACRTTSSRFRRHVAYDSPSPSAVSLTLTFESRPSRWISSKTSRYAWAIARASASRAISSPSTSIVAIFPSALSFRTTATASSSVGPAMYGAENICTTGFGTAGSRRTRARSSSVMRARVYVSRMKPWRAALTSAPASGNNSRIASRSAIACSSMLPFVSICESAAAVSSTAVLSVSVANCSRCASCTDSACCSSNSRRPRIKSSGSPPNGNPKPPPPPSIGRSLGEGSLVTPLDLRGQLLDGGHRLLERRGKGRCAVLAERFLQPAGSNAELVEIRRRREARLLLQRLLEGERGCLGLVDALPCLAFTQSGERGAKLREAAAPRCLLGDLAERGERGCVAQGAAALDRRPEVIE